MQPKMK